MKFTILSLSLVVLSSCGSEQVVEIRLDPSAFERSPRRQAEVDLITLQGAVENYILSTVSSGQARLPESLEEVRDFYSGPSVVKDPWGYEYRFEAHDGWENGLGFRVWSYGADNAPGGEGENSDIDGEEARRR